MAATPQINPEKEVRPGDDECRALVARILAGPEFQRATRLRAFLNYVVDRTLAGRPEEITEVLIGHRVFGRSATYNPGDDSIVRTEARNLRQRLDRYFSGRGAAESILLEIPRGGYVPVFHVRSAAVVEDAANGQSPVSPAPPQPSASRRNWLIFGAAGFAAAATGISIWRRPAAAARSGPTGASPVGAMHLESSDPRLTAAFQNARERALACVFTGDPVGDWFASNRDNRAFCMRDAAHENAGAALLGLYRQTLNIFRRFAASIAASRDWCAYWIITKDGYPSSTEYRSDRDFRYSLPANFDLLRACYQQMLWTGDRQYLDVSITAFCDRTVSDYVKVWDKNGDGLMETTPERPLVTGSYNLQPPLFATGADLVAAQYRGYLAYAAIQAIKGGPGSLSDQIAKEYGAKARALRERFNQRWWDGASNRYHSGIMPDGSWNDEPVAPCYVYPLRFGIPEDGPKTEAALDWMESHRPPFDSTYSHYPEVLYRYNRNDSAYRHLLRISDPAFSGYKMGETAFAAIGSIGSGLLGINPDALRSTVETMPRLPKDVAWVRATNIPVAANQITVEHRGNGETRFTNQSGDPLVWRPVFPLPSSSTGAGIAIDNRAAPKLALEHRTNGQAVITAAMPVHAGQTRVAKLVL